MHPGDDLPLFESIPTTNTSQPAPFPNDPWLASSALQKAIRRGEAEIASAAASVLHRIRGSSIWTRLIVIAFEDIGAAHPEVLIETVTACSDPEWRRQAGGNTHVVRRVVKRMALAPKDRSADHLICTARSHPSLADVRAHLASASIADRIAMSADPSLTITERAAAAWYASGVEWGDETRVGHGDLAGLLDTFRSAGVPSALLDATRIGAKRTREPITVMLPVLWLAAKADPTACVADCAVPPSQIIEGVPAYAMDTHTRSGRRAIDLFARECPEVAASLSDCVAPALRSQAARLTAFYTDGAPVARKLQWAHGDELERLGVENDFLSVGVAPSAIPELLQTFHDHLEQLNEIRARVLREALRAFNTGANR